MNKLKRFGVSVEDDLLAGFDELIHEEGYTNRSEAFRDMIRQRLVRTEWTGKGTVAGAVILVYDHHRRDLLNKLTDIQHDHQELIISTQHVHLDHDNCLETIVVKGSPSKINALSWKLRAAKGVKCGQLAVATTGKDLV